MVPSFFIFGSPNNAAPFRAARHVPVSIFYDFTTEERRGSKCVSRVRAADRPWPVISAVILYTCALDVIAETREGCFGGGGGGRVGSSFGSRQIDRVLS